MMPIPTSGTSSMRCTSTSASIRHWAISPRLSSKRSGAASRRPLNVVNYLRPLLCPVFWGHYSSSSMRFIVDESTGAAVVTYLRNIGHDVVSVADTMPQADDTVILAYAASEGRVVLTNDKDFGELAFRSGQVHRGIVL